jgi:hypothetical protein
MPSKKKRRIEPMHLWKPKYPNPENWEFWITDSLNRFLMILLTITIVFALGVQLGIHHGRQLEKKECQKGVINNDESNH